MVRRSDRMKIILYLMISQGLSSSNFLWMWGGGWVWRGSREHSRTGMTPVMWPGGAGVGGSADKPGEGRNFLRAWSCHVPWKPLLSFLPALTVIEDSWGNCQGQNYRKLPCGQWGFSGYFPQWLRAVMASCLLAGCLCFLVRPSSQETLASVPSIFAQLLWIGFYPLS